MITGFVEDQGDFEENPLLLCSKFFFLKSVVYRISSEEKIDHYSIAFGL